MRLKSLELIGYKTFASKTTFEFAENITAIVGPNGSGKSNVVDALRWVLGEQSYSLLRGRKTVDMIFSGSEQRSRAGMASSSVLFDNSDGWLPIDFSEVAITRRAFRDGQNEYLINGQKVRLRDISELLAQSGLAQRTYTMVGQGLVDVALSLKAEERRKLFEEAAGIGLYRSRREEALRRLDTTRRNLERVQDILAELKPRLRSLERQARRAREYDQVKADLEVMLREWYGYHWHRAQREMKKARDLAQTQESKLGTLRKNQADLDQKMRALRERVHVLRAQLNDWHQELAGLNRQRERFSRELAVSAERQRALADRRASLNVGLTHLEEEIRLHREQLDTADKNLARYQTQGLDAGQRLKNARQDLEKFQKEIRLTEGALNDLRARQSELKARQVEHKTRSAELKMQIERQRETLSAVERRLAEAQSLEEKSETAVAEKAQEFETAQNIRQQADSELASQREQLAVLEKRRREAMDARGAQQTETTLIQTKLDVLEQAEQTLSGYAEGARALLQAARDGKLKGPRGALSSHLDVPSEYETAIAAALGEFLDGVLVESDPSWVLEFLETQPGRVALLPLDRMVPQEVHPIPDEAQILGRAADLVQAAGDIRPVVDLLLGNTWVVSDRGAALRLINASPLPTGLRVVTLRGEVFHAQGPILAGQQSSAGTISRVRQRRELLDALKDSQGKLSGLEARIQNLDTQIEQLKGQEMELRTRLGEARSDEENARLAHAQAVHTLENAIQQKNWTAGQKETITRRMQTAARDIEKIEEEATRFEALIGAVKEEMQQKNHQLGTLSLEEAQRQVSHWTTQAALADRALADATSRKQERQDALDRSLKRLDDQRKEMRKIDEEIARLEAERVALRGREGETGDQITNLLAHIQPAETELETSERERDALQVAEAQARNALTTAERYHAQAQIGLVRSQEALESLREKVEDDFGLVAFEYEEEVAGPTPLPLGSDMVETLPFVRKLAPEIETAIKRQRAQLRRIGAINPEAQQEYQQVSQRFAFTTSQIADLEKAEKDILQVISELDLLMEREFRKTYQAVAQEFKAIFTRLFGGGTAQLVLTDPQDLTHTGVDIEARLPGRRSQELSLLSGGERSLTATALIFSLLKVPPTPFCVLDEVDAMLDEANVNRFSELLQELSQNTQFVIITHNRNTVQAADTIYGVTMGKDSTSQVLGLKLDEVAEKVKGLS